MNARLPFLKWTLLLPMLALPAADLRGERLPGPSWLGNEPLIIVGNWDSMPIFRRRVGGSPVWQEEDYAREHTEETVVKLKELGVSMAVIHFYKGFGLKAEAPHIEDARKLAALCRKHGMRVGVYIGSTIGFETFLDEVPEAQSWFVPPYLGRPVIYGGDQNFRKRVYFMHPGYREYMKRVLRLAIEDLKVDLIHFDNTSNQAEPPIFHHPLAIQEFRDYLQDKYTPDALERRLGIRGARFVEPPQTDRPLRVINDPAWQEWAQFRCKRLNDYYSEMERFIRGLNPEVAVESNPHLGVSGTNTVWQQGVDYPGFMRHMDVVWTEERNEAGVNAEGILVSKIRTYKMASLLKNSVFTYTGGTRGAKLEMAEAMTYNRQCLGMVGGVLAGYDTPPDQRKYIQFYRKAFEYYRGVENKADVAVLHSFPSMAYNNDGPWQGAMLLEQALIQARVPFDIVFDDNLEDLSKYRVLALPDQECLGDDQMALIREWVKGGGGLVATGLTSLYNEFRQRRRDFGLGDLFKVKAPDWRGSRAEESAVKSGPVRHAFGGGRVAYVPAIRPAIQKPPAAPMTSRYWKLPVNWLELISAVKWAAGGRLSLDVQAPATVTAEVLEQKDPARLLVHLINYDAQRTPAVAKIGVTLRLPEGKTAGEVILLSPDETRSQLLAAATAAGAAVFTVPQLKTYGVAVVNLK